MTMDATESLLDPEAFWDETDTPHRAVPAGRRTEKRGGRTPVRSSDHRDDIQGLRAIAVLLVVLGHSGIGFLRGGYVGVDVFFVLSGFLITGVLLGGATRRGFVSFTDFYMRRARRILPAAALTLVVTDIVAYQLLNFVRAKQVVLDSVWASAFAANVRFSRLGVDYFAQGQPPRRSSTSGRSPSRSSSTCCGRPWSPSRCSASF
jgi:acyltransferase-like protein